LFKTPTSSCVRSLFIAVLAETLRSATKGIYLMSAEDVCSR
jgi:hypothetical protein